MGTFKEHLREHFKDHFMEHFMRHFNEHFKKILKYNFKEGAIREVLQGVFLRSNERRFSISS